MADGVRIDKWLWAARFFKTRTLATTAADGGHVKVNGDTAKPARSVKIGDEVDVLTPGGRRIVGVLALGEKRGPAAEARLLYEDRTPEEYRRPAPGETPSYREEARGRRPSKKQRRDIRRLRGW